MRVENLTPDKNVKKDIDNFFSNVGLSASYSFVDGSETETISIVFVIEEYTFSNALSKGNSFDSFVCLIRRDSFTKRQPLENDFLIFKEKRFIPVSVKSADINLEYSDSDDLSSMLRIAFTANETLKRVSLYD